VGPTRGPFERLLGMEILDLNERLIRMTMPYRVELTNPKGIIHGGAISSLADTAMAILVYSKFGACYTAKFEIEFKAQAQGDLFAEAQIVNKRMNLYVCQAEIKDFEKRLIAKAAGKFLVL
jgi:acyl-CoA thioesterase